MASMIAYLDDFGKITVWINSNFYNGRSDNFWLIDDQGLNVEMPVRETEDTYSGKNYTLAAPADIEFGKPYYVREQHGLIVPLVIRLIVQTEEFNRRFYYSGDDLGPVYHRMHTDFAVWAPTAISVILSLKVNGRMYAYPMERTANGVYRKSVIGDLKNATYRYMVESNGKVVSCLDPYAYSCLTNGRESAVIDLERVEAEPKVKPHGNVTGTDAVIYEVSVRDITASPLTGTKDHRTFNALTEEGTTYKGIPTGLNHIVSLGVTHVQLLPVFDFTTVNEFHPEQSYNWGYDPEQYLAPEGSYSSNPEDPYARMIELRRMISNFHKHDLRVNLDVVFNHLYETERNCFEGLVPYYYLRYNASGRPSNGSYCGNEFASNQPMGRKFIVDCIRKIIELYDIDGLRFDLMGLLDVTTMNTIRETGLKLKPGFMVYGEGWDMPTSFDSKKKAMIGNQEKMPHIGHFNDYFRDVVKGKTSDGERYESGFATGDLGMGFGTLSALVGNVLPKPYFKRFETPDQSINGFETHDNGTLWDKMHFCCNNEDRAVRKKRHRLMLGMTMVAQGIPFLHAGIEFCATKNDNMNSYNAGDAINMLDWERAVFYKDMTEYTRKAIALRKQYRSFRLKDTAGIARYVHLQNQEGGVLFYDISLMDEDAGVRDIRVIINAADEDHSYDFTPGWRMLFDEKGDPKPGMTEHITVPALSMIVLGR